MSNSEPYFLDDRVIIPDDVKKMSKEQLKQEIARLEKETRQNKPQFSVMKALRSQKFCS